MARQLLLSAGLAFLASWKLLDAQDSFWDRWLKRSDRARAAQPSWMTPLVTVTPRLEQEIRTDFLVQPLATRHDLVNFGNTKGLELIPVERIQIVFSPPPYIQHNDPRLKDGFGDVSFLMKIRLLSANEENGNYVVTAFLAGSAPTGSYNNGARSGIITPTVAAGKGLGRFDIQGTLNAGLPVSQAETIGHAIVLNTACQYHVFQKLWPEVEINSTFWKGGERDGKKQTFLTAGLILGRFKLHGHMLMSLGAGYQTALTHYHTYNHGLVITLRFPF